MVRAQGGDSSVIYHPERFARAPYAYAVTAPRDGYITRVDAESYGRAACLLGAGRNTVADVIDPAAGMILHAKTGDYIRAGEPIATLYASNEGLFAAAEQTVLCATFFGDTPPAPRPLIWDRVE